MENNSREVWKGKDSISILANHRVDFNRATLKKYILSHNKNINQETFFHFFTENSLTKKDEETGCYMSHLLLLDAYRYDVCKDILKLLLDGNYLSPFDVNDKGQTYADCIFQSPSLEKEEIIDLLEQAIRDYSINFNNLVDYQGNNITHWIAVSRYNYDFLDFSPYFSKCLVYDENKNGIDYINLWYLAEALYESEYFYNMHFNMQETDQHIILTIHVFKSKYKLKDFAKQRDIEKGDFSFDTGESIYPKDEIIMKLLRNHKYASLHSAPSPYGMDVLQFDTFQKQLKK